MRAALAILALAVLATSPAPAQEAPAPGQRVRLELRDGRVIVGQVEQLGADTLRFRRPGVHVSELVVRDSVAGFSLSLGRSHDAGARRGLRVGAIAGGAAWLLLLGAGALADASSDEETFIPATVVGAVYGGAIFLGTTAGGTIIGALVGRERWGPRTTVGLRHAR